MYGYIYLTTNKITGLQYIGQHKASEFTESYKGSGTSLKKAIKKYGWDSFDVVMVKPCNSKEELDLAEIDMIKVYRGAYGKKHMYNRAKGGSGNQFTIRR